MEKTKTSIKQKIVNAGVAVIGLAFIAHAGASFGLYDLSAVYTFLNVDPAAFGWATISPAVGYLIAKIGYDVVKTNQTYQASLDVFNTDRLVASQDLVTGESRATNVRLDRNHAANVETQRLLQQSLDNDAEKRKVIAGLSLSSFNLKKAQSSLSKLKANIAKKD